MVDFFSISRVLIIRYRALWTKAVVISVPRIIQNQKVTGEYPLHIVLRLAVLPAEFLVLKPLEHMRRGVITTE